MANTAEGFEESVATECCPADALAEIMRQIRVHWSIQPADPSSFRVRARRRGYGSVIFAEMEVDSCTGFRGPHEIRSAEGEYICLTYYSQGRQRFSQRAAEAEIGADQLLIWDSAQPAEFACPVPTRGATIMFPRAMVLQKMGNERTVFSRNAFLNEATTRLLASHCRLLHETVDMIPPRNRLDVISSTLDLLLSCTTMAESGSSTSYKLALWARVQQHVRERLDDDELCVEDVANAFGFSKRYLQSLFAENNTTFLQFAREERLDRAARALTSPQFACNSVTEIAHRFGFYDLSHFSRTFRKRFTQSPSAYRGSVN